MSTAPDPTNAALPVITVVPPSPTGSDVYDASTKAEYVDPGATCRDAAGNDLNHAVHVSGQVVNMRVPGTYTVRYDCQDLSGNHATHTGVSFWRASHQSCVRTDCTLTSLSARCPWRYSGSIKVNHGAAG